MKRSLKISLIIGFSMLIFGIMICVATLVVFDFNWRAFDTSFERTKQSYTASGIITSININTSFDDVFVIPTTDTECSIEYYSGEKDICEVTFNDGVLTITQTENYKWYEKINIFTINTEKQGVTVYLPNANYESVLIDTASGDVKLNNVLALKSKINTASGDIELEKFKSNELNLNSLSGDIELDSFEGDKLHLKTTSGDISVDNIIAKDIELYSTSGECEMEKINADTLKSKTVSGDFSAENLKAIGLAEIKTTSGEITLETSDAGEFDISAVSGDVFCRVLTNKCFEAKTTSGDIKIPPSDINGGYFKVKTTSGDIVVKYVD